MQTSALSFSTASTKALEGMASLNLAPNDTHPNAEAHEVMARVLAERIEALLPQAGQGGGSGAVAGAGPES
jgi:lysophospholipase L1-like esterase